MFKELLNNFAHIYFPLTNSAGGCTVQLSWGVLYDSLAHLCAVPQVECVKCFIFVQKKTVNASFYNITFLCVCVDIF